jgi:nicotinate-nucleotide pyrophosphorylase
MDGVHTAWIVVEVDSKEQARSILPPAFRSQAKIVALNKFTLEQVEGIISQHQR